MFFQIPEKKEGVKVFVGHVDQTGFHIQHTFTSTLELDTDWFIQKFGQIKDTFLFLLISSLFQKKPVMNV